MRFAGITSLFAAAVAGAACTTYDDYGSRPVGYGDYAYVGRDYQRLGNDCGFFEGEGGSALDPWLACTEEGRRLVRDRYDDDQDRRVTLATADEANIWFRRHADTDRDMQLTDGEVKAALVNHVRFAEGSGN
ncbi:hypothetical protein [Allosphingosinicella deserti]|uniref:Uncharacterized protein n=1 Tax=Allosphingosinicella deserti TaxID=2116704 RepID=A0A2P7QH47_9SPHN|nr:hypothetical protein [Sphingomonas deserti]PSJ37285.1 hypothetical protein C7I55_22450 [Sphingomonas deserti]